MATRHDKDRSGLVDEKRTPKVAQKRKPPHRHGQDAHPIIEGGHATDKQPFE